MLRIMLVNIETWRLEPILSHSEVLEAHDVFYVRRRPEVIVCSTLSEEILNQGVPIIVCSYCDSASCPEWLRCYLERDELVGVFQNTALRPKTLYNQQVAIGEEYHWHLVNQYAKQWDSKTPDPLNEAQLAKIHCVLWNVEDSAFAALHRGVLEEEIDFDAPRGVDVFLSCRLENDNNPAYRWHREQAIDRIRQLKHLATVTQNTTGQKYKETVKNARIMVSPWGLGEWCHRDFVAAYSGSLLIKPDTDFVTDHADFYRSGQTYVACKPDFSDLQEKVDQILSDYDAYLPMRKAARKCLVSHFDDSKIAARFCSQVNRCCGIH